MFLRKNAYMSLGLDDGIQAPVKEPSVHTW
jgi:hypothetical protein